MRIVKRLGSRMQGTAVELTRDTAAGTTSGRRYVLGVLTALSTFSYLDQQLMGILLEPLRREFTLTDIELGFLSGTRRQRLPSPTAARAALGRAAAGDPT